MKKIVFVIESLQMGGAEKCLVTLLKQLDCTKIEIDLILFNKVGVFIEQVPENVNIIYLENKRLTNVERILYLYQRKIYKGRLHNAQILWKIIEDKFVLIQKKYDLVVAFNQGFATYFASRYLIGEKKIAWLNTNYKSAGYDIDFDYPIYSKFSTVVTVSNQVEQIFREILNIKNYQLRTETIRDIVDENEIIKKAGEEVEFKMDTSIFNVITIGRLAKPKAIDLAIKSCAVLVSKGYKIKWYVVGEGSEREYLQTLISQYKLEDTFILLGQHKNPYPYLAQATVFAQTSLFEGLGTTVLEAKVLNKPIVSTSFPSIYSMIEDEKTGLIAGMDAESIAAKIERLLLDDALRTTFTNNLAKQKNNDKEESLHKINNLFS